MTRLRSTSFGLCLATLIFAVSCTQDSGESCQVDGDCGDGLICCGKGERGFCGKESDPECGDADEAPDSGANMSVDSGATEDAGATDAAAPDAAAPDAAMSTMDDAGGDAG